MSKDTGIQWCDSTVNPTMGCDGCELWTSGRAGRPAVGEPGEPGYRPAAKPIPARMTCYAGAMHRQYGGTRKKDGGPTGYAKRFEEVQEFPGRMAEAARWKDLTGTDRELKPWLNGLPRLIFVSDMSDALSKAISFDYLKREVIDVVRSMAFGGGRHCWLWLTKRPSRMAALSLWLEQEFGEAWPVNLWAMTSVTSEETLPRIDALMNVGASMASTVLRAVSFEPIAGPIPVKQHLRRLQERLGERFHAIDWAIIGGESEQAAMGPAGRAADCHERHLVDLAEQLDELGIARFTKQLGSRFVGVRVLGRLATPPAGDSMHARFLAQGGRLDDSHGGEWEEWEWVNPTLRMRRMPAWPKGTQSVDGGK